VDSIFKNFLKISGYLFLVLVASIFVTLIIQSQASIEKFGFSFLFSKEWNPVTEVFGALPFIAGTVITSFLALIISIPFSLSISLILGEYLKKGIFANFLTYATDLLSGVPSVVFGFWGLLTLVPIVRKFQVKAGVVPYGVGIFTASLILAIMIIPYASAIIREIFKLVPNDLKEAAYGLGATRFEVIKYVVFPYAKSGIFAGLLLSLGRALGETMAVTMVIGNMNLIPSSIFFPGNTMASVIANEFSEASDTLYLSSLVEIGLILFVITILINMLGNYIINKTKVKA